MTLSSINISDWRDINSRGLFKRKPKKISKICCFFVNFALHFWSNWKSIKSDLEIIPVKDSEKRHVLAHRCLVGLNKSMKKEIKEFLE